MEVVKENVNSRLLVSTLNKTNKNELIVVRTNYSIVKQFVLRKVNTLTGGSKMKKEFEEASGKMKEALMKMQEIIEKMGGDINEKN